MVIHTSKILQQMQATVKLQLKSLKLSVKNSAGQQENCWITDTSITDKSIKK